MSREGEEPSLDEKVLPTSISADEWLAFLERNRNNAERQAHACMMILHHSKEMQEEGKILEKSFVERIVRGLSRSIRLFPSQGDLPAGACLLYCRLLPDDGLMK